MITQTNFQGPDSDRSSDLKNEMSPQTSLHPASFDDEDFDIPQVALPANAMGNVEEEKSLHAMESRMQQQQQQQQHQQQTQMMGYGGQAGGYAEYYGQEGQQWLGEYQNHQLSYNYNPSYGQQQYQQQQQQYGQQYGVYPSREEMYHGGSIGNLPPGRSPSGSHSTPSPHSQAEMGEEHLGHHGGLSDLKRPHADAFRHDNMNLSSQNAVKKPKVSRRKKKRDPNEPQKPVSAYALFFRDSQASIKGRNPNMSFGDVSKCVASMWDALDPDSKAMYKKRTEMAKKEYLRQLASYRATLVSNGQGDEIYGGFPGYGYPSMGSMGLGQSIPPHPPGPPQPHQGVYLTNSQEYGQLNHQAAGHGTRGDISSGNQQGIRPSLPQGGSHQGDTGNTSPSPPLSTGQPYPSPEAAFCPEPPYLRSTNPHFDNSFHQGPHDRNHNSPGYAPRVPGQCGRPGCQNPVTKASDGTESTYCSSECVVGQCREVYTSWSSHHNPGNPLPTQQPVPAQVK